MKKETKEFVRLFGIALVVMMAVPLAYRVCIHFWPPDEKPRQAFMQFLKGGESDRCTALLVKPVGKWTEAEARLEPEIHAWLKEQGNEILPWEWTEEARRKDPKGYAKCWRRIWKERMARCERLVAQHHKELARLDRERQDLATIHAHRTNQIARLHFIATTNAFPCKVALERLEKGRFWGWNRKVEVVACKDAAAIMAATNGLYSKEVAAAQDETAAARAVEGAISAAKERLALHGRLHEICDQNSRAVEGAAVQDEALRKSLVENLKGAQ